MGAPQIKSVQSWRLLYEAALLEFDPIKLSERIAAAKKAMAKEAVILIREGSDSSERHALEDAMQVLERLKPQERSNG